MTTKRPITTGVANSGVHHVGKIVSACNSIFQPVDQSNDVGIDAYIEFIVDESATGCSVAAQIKSGRSYIRDGHFIVPTDPAHFEYWRSHSLPVVGIVYDPDTDAARWVDITEDLERRRDEPPFTLKVPDENLFDVSSFQRFRDHFLGYRSRYSDQEFFASALIDLAAIDEPLRRWSGLKSLFSFHRQRLESWFYLITTLRSFQDTPLLRNIIIILTHIPGHGDIFWHKGNITTDEVRLEAARLMRTLLTRDEVIVLLAGIENETGLSRGSIGQCVLAIVEIVAKRDQILESIAGDIALSEDVRYRALCLLIAFRQVRDSAACIRLASELVKTFTGSNALLTKQLVTDLKQHGSIDFT